MNASGFEAHADVAVDIDEAAFWYEVEFGAGSSFLDAVNATFERIMIAPLAFAVRRADVRMAIVHGPVTSTMAAPPSRDFPHGVYFSVDETRRVTVWAVASLQREPWYWLGRTSRRR